MEVLRHTDNRDRLETCNPLTHPQAVLQIEVLKHTDNRGNFYDNSSMLAALLQALGRLRAPDSKSLKQAVHQLDRFLARERVLPSYHGIVAQAALQAFMELALAMKGNAPFRARWVGMHAGICCGTSCPESCCGLAIGLKGELRSVSGYSACTQPDSKGCRQAVHNLNRISASTRVLLAWNAAVVFPTLVACAGLVCSCAGQRPFLAR